MAKGNNKNHSDVIYEVNNRLYCKYNIENQDDKVIKSGIDKILLNGEYCEVDNEDELNSVKDLIEQEKKNTIYNWIKDKELCVDLNNLIKYNGRIIGYYIDDEHNDNIYALYQILDNLPEKVFYEHLIPCSCYSQRELGPYGWNTRKTYEEAMDFMKMPNYIHKQDII